MAALRSERDELQERMKTEQQSAEESSRRADDLQRKVDQNAGELAQVTAELKQLSTERQEAEARAGEQQESAQALIRKLEADWTTAVERNVRFEEELVTLRKERDGLTLQIKTEKLGRVGGAFPIDEHGRYARATFRGNFQVRVNTASHIHRQRHLAAIRRHGEKFFVAGFFRRQVNRFAVR